MKIMIDKLSNKHQDSIWYSGYIAELNGFELRALGQIKGEFNGEIMKDDSLISDLLENNLNDDDLTKVELIDNNWYEIIYPDGDSYVPDEQTYDSVIKELERVANETY